MNTLRVFVAASLLAFACSPLSAAVRLPAVLSDHMVLQAAKPAAIWGWAEPGEQVTVEFAGQAKSATTDAAGRWRIALDPLQPSDNPQSLVVRGPSNTVEVADVLVGEVWFCSGQSNMAMQLKGLHGEVVDADEVIAAADHPTLRMFVHDAPFDIYALPAPATEPQADRPGRWIVCSPETAARFTALGYFFACDLQRELKLPVGLVSSAVGGTPIEAWTSLPAQRKVAELQPLLAEAESRLVSYDPQQANDEFLKAKQAWLKDRAAARKQNRPDPKAPAVFRNQLVLAPGRLYNAMIAPLVPYTVRGVLWYQGERNAAGPFTQLYGRQLRTLIADWRAHWGEPDLYFAYVQLPKFGKEQKLPSEPNGWGVSVREGQWRTTDVPHTAMAVTIDVGDPSEGHPRNKADFARRLSLLALHDVYGRTDVNARGPLYESHRREGKSLVVSFDHAAGLKAATGDLRGFAIAGADKKFYAATATIRGGDIVLTSDNVAEPVAVRYGWAGNPTCNLVNQAGLPASPFRTDDWNQAK